MSGDQSLLKRINRMALIRHVKAHPGLARGDLAALTGLAESTISVLVNELIDEGWLRAHDAPGGGGVGRRPQLLDLDTTRLAPLGADLGVDYLSVVACDLRGEILSARRIDYHHREVERSVRALAGLVARVHAALLAGGHRPLGVGVGVPGMVTTGGLLRLAPNIGWRDVAVGPLLEAALAREGCGALELAVLNDADAAALSEFVFGSPPVPTSLVFLNLGYGVGSGVVLSDGLHVGHDGLAGEVGHSILQPGGIRCACGRRGCAETLLSQRALSRAVSGRDEPVLPVAELEARIRAGDAAAARAVAGAAETLGLVMHNLVVTLDPEVLIVGGPLSRLDGLLEAAMVSMRAHAGENPSHRATVRASRFGADACAVGAAGSVLQRSLTPLGRATPWGGREDAEHRGPRAVSGGRRGRRAVSRAAR